MYYSIAQIGVWGPAFKRMKFYCCCHVPNYSGLNDLRVEACARRLSRSVIHCFVKGSVPASETYHS